MQTLHLSLTARTVGLICLDNVWVDKLYQWPLLSKTRLHSVKEWVALFIPSCLLFPFLLSVCELIYVGAFNFQDLSVIESIRLPSTTVSFCLSLHILFIFFVIRYFIYWSFCLFVTYYLILSFSFTLGIIFTIVFFLDIFLTGNTRRKRKAFFW